jgi:hypothetical protein
MSAPRIPRQPPLTPMQTACACLVGLALLGAVIGAWVVLAALWRWVSWMGGL